MNFIWQCFALLRVNLSGVTQRIGPVLTIVVGVTCAVGTLTSMLAMGVGAREQETNSSGPEYLVISTTGTQYEQGSVTRDEVTGIRALPGIVKGHDGEPLVLLESMVPIEARRRGTGAHLYFPILGTSSNVTEFRPELHLTAGRMFQRGLHELVSSDPCVRQFEGFDIGDRRPLHGSDWTIVGHFIQGKNQQCVVLADVDSLMSLFSRNTYSSVAVRLQSVGDFDQVRKAVADNPALHLEVRHEAEALQEIFEPLNNILSFVSYFVGTIMALAATLGAVNSLYAIVDSRRRELATLRAIGFSPAAVVLATLVESMILAIPGALLGTLLAWAFFNGLSASPFGFTFQLAVTPPLAITGIVWALAMGLLGGLLPAVRAARTPVTTALRAT